MKLNDLIVLSDIVERLAEKTDSTIPEVLGCLSGVVLSEEDIGQISQYHQDEEDV